MEFYHKMKNKQMYPCIQAPAVNHSGGLLLNNQPNSTGVSTKPTITQPLNTTTDTGNYGNSTF